MKEPLWKFIQKTRNWRKKYKKWV